MARDEMDERYHFQVMRRAIEAVDRLDKLDDVNDLTRLLGAS